VPFKNKNEREKGRKREEKRTKTQSHVIIYVCGICACPKDG
jgi:hypothetical protein